jgi:hypothetical protein
MSDPVEVFVHPPDPVDMEYYWGWQCFRCGAVQIDLADIDAAEIARDQHQCEEEEDG